SPGLVATIFDKIQRSVVVVADVTLVGEVAGTADTAAGRKKLINSNVAIELGYALCHLTDQGVLLVFNKHYGSYEELPFDLRHRGGAVFFDLSPNANREDIESERKKLTSQFVEKLKPYLQKPPAPIVPFPEIPSTYCKAAYFDKGEILATREPVTYKYSTETLGYLRLIPTTPLAEPLNLTTLEHAAQRAPLLGKW